MLSSITRRRPPFYPPFRWLPSVVTLSPYPEFKGARMKVKFHHQQSTSFPWLLSAPHIAHAHIRGYQAAIVHWAPLFILVLCREHTNPLMYILLAVIFLPRVYRRRWESGTWESHSFVSSIRILRWNGSLFWHFARFNWKSFLRHFIPFATLLGLGDSRLEVGWEGFGWVHYFRIFWSPHTLTMVKLCK